MIAQIVNIKIFWVEEIEVVLAKPGMNVLRISSLNAACCWIQIPWSGVTAKYGVFCWTCADGTTES